MVDLFWLLLPNEALPLVFVGLGLAVIVGLVSLRHAMSVILMIIGVLIATPFIEALLGSLPWWVGVLVLLLMGIWVARVVLTAIFGRHAAGHVIGTAVVGASGLLFRLAVLPLRLAGRLVLLLAGRP